MSGFLTRLLAMNERGPNVVLAPDPEALREQQKSCVEWKWRCDVCRDCYSICAEAEECCKNTANEHCELLPEALMVHIVWRCGNCAETHLEENKARTCCQGSDLVSMVYACPDCDDCYDHEDDAIECCLPHVQDVAVNARMPQCMVCMHKVQMGSVNDRVQWWTEAARCCLPVKSDVLTTEDCDEVARLLVSGVSWADAVAQVEAQVREKRKEQACQMH